jgi:signal transduction histidine kinase
MQIRARLTLLFVLIVALIQFIASMAIYWNAAQYRERTFFEKMKASGISKALFYMEVSGSDSTRLRSLEELSSTFLPREEMLIYNYKNELLYASDPRRRIKVSAEMLDGVRLNGEIRFTQEEYELAGFMFTDRFNRLVVISGGIDQLGWDNLNYLKRLLMVVYALSIGVISLLAWLYSGAALKPIQEIMKQADRLQLSHMKERLPESNSKDEIAQLTATINRMFDRIEASFAMQKQFVANASHELRTPLTAIRGQLEVLLMKSRTPEVYAEKLQQVLDDMKKLTGIANQLLMIAQAESQQSREQFHPLRVDELLFGLQSRLQMWYPNARIHIFFTDELSSGDDLMVKGHEELLSAAFFNLMENGLKYSAKKELRIQLLKNHDLLELRFEDEGIGIPSEDIDRIFQPFYRSSNAGEKTGSGLGLSLVERIIALHSGQIRVRSVVGKGSTFTILLPK